MTVTLYPCGRGHRCAQVTIDPDTHEKHPARTPHTFCDPCAGHIADRIRDLPTVYRELREQYGIQRTAADDDVRVHTSRVNPSIPVREDLDALLTEIETTVAAYEDRVRQVLGMGPAPRVSWAHRAARVDQACTLLAAKVVVLTDLPMEWTAIHGTHDERGGLDAGLDLLDLHRRADRAGGKQPAKYVVPVVCPSCHIPAGVTREAGKDGATCMCGYVLGEDEYRQLTGELAGVAGPLLGVAG
ncbi:hypothetical protein Q8791_23710 [Nocardiopsis sp. CT-R113]|uniref:Uncharacterized protein n=1 Tax=Nocardiopsis codii TaxID=3065942 RepID=A0ABU7KF53_9ACTN|nr:hypothetical protein [Nocardiopsis sp. CT-R113]MEE2040227.1 hypothetical protein [Nocardiopsis sp. CT-R113]